MDRVSIYEYDRKNRERVVKAIEEAGGQILSWSFFAKDIDVSRYSNMRDINSEIMRQITDALYAQIVK